MPPVVVAFLFAAGLSTWIYTKVSRSTGNNTQSSLIVSAVAFAFAFVIILIVLGMVDKALQ